MHDQGGLIHDDGDEVIMPTHWTDESGRGHLLARYANYFMVGHNPNEFIVDFGQCDVGGEAQKIHTRIVTAPFYAKAFLNVLQQSINEYEEQFGAIE
jgi:hypothetical protein